MKKKMILLAVLILLLTGLVTFALMGDEIMYFLDPVCNDWVERNNRVYYHDENGDPVTGWFEDEGYTYYLNPKKRGAMTIGWAEIEGDTYYMDPLGHLLTGWQEIDGENYYLGETGAMAVGWTALEDGTYYFQDDGSQVSGWMELDGSEYYLGETGRVTGWLELEDCIYYLNDSGVRVTGMTEVDGVPCYLSPEGSAETGWLELDGEEYYVNPDCTLATGWLNLDGDTYYLDETGAKATGWQEIDGAKHYLLEDGTAASGRMVVDDVPCYFSSTGEYVLLVNRWNPLPDDYDPELKTIEGWQVSAVCYDALTQMLSDCPHPYTINSAYRSQAGQQGIWDERYARHKSEGYSDAEALKLVEDYVARPGTSEHQLGLAVDLGGVDAQIWLREHCWEYGFILRYPEGKSDITGIAYERWHFRYVGKALAMEMKGTGLCLEEYLDSLTTDGTTAGNPDLK